MSWREGRRRRVWFDSFFSRVFWPLHFLPCERAIIPVASSHSVIFTRFITTRLILLLHCKRITVRSSRYGRFVINILITFIKRFCRILTEKVMYFTWMWTRQIFHCSFVLIRWNSLNTPSSSAPSPLSACIDVRAVRTATTSTRALSNSPRRFTFYPLIFSKIQANLGQKSHNALKSRLTF